MVFVTSVIAADLKSIFLDVRIGVVGNDVNILVAVVVIDSLSDVFVVLCFEDISLEAIR